MGLAMRVFPLLLIFSWALSFAGPPPAGKNTPPDLLFILIDTLRADHLGCYGYSRPTSPAIDNLAARGILFKQAFSPADWTNPAIVSLFTGRYPQAVLPPALHREAIRLVVPGEAVTLAETLKGAGYRTVGLVAHPGIHRSLGYGQGFDEFVHLAKVAGIPAELWPTVDPGVVEREFARVTAPGGPLFLYLHLVYPHWPYDPPAPYNSMFGPGYEKIRPEEKAGIINQYDGEIRLTDDLVGRILKKTEAAGRLANTYVVITADHGESFWEHGSFGHGKTYFNEEIMVPLIIVPPAGRGPRGRVVQTPVSTVDLFPTFLEFAGVHGEFKIDGRSLTRYFSGEPAGGEDGPLFCESNHTGDIKAAAVIRKGTKLIQGTNDLVFDLAQDPQETRNLADAKLPVLELLKGFLWEHREMNDFFRQKLKQKTEELDQDTQEGLKALGYIE